jgi:hypothetical protein
MDMRVRWKPIIKTPRWLEGSIPRLDSHKSSRTIGCDGLNRENKKCQSRKREGVKIIVGNCVVERLCRSLLARKYIVLRPEKKLSGIIQWRNGQGQSNQKPSVLLPGHDSVLRMTSEYTVPWSGWRLKWLGSTPWMELSEMKWSKINQFGTNIDELQDTAYRHGKNSTARHHGRWWTVHGAWEYLARVVWFNVIINSIGRERQPGRGASIAQSHVDHDI